MPRIRLVMASALFATAAVCAAPGIPVRSVVVTPRPASSAVVQPDKPLLVRTRQGRYRVDAPWLVQLDSRVWRVPRGYSCNGITAPPRVKARLGDGVEHAETWAAVFHDWLFTQPGISRAEADILFHRLLLAYGVSPMKARMMYTSVRAYSVVKGTR